LFVASALYEKGLGHVIRSVAPFVALMLIGLGIITWYPQVSVGLGNAIMGGDSNMMVGDDEDGDGEPSGMPTMEEMMQEAIGDDTGEEEEEEELEEAEEPVEEEAPPPDTTE
jgi:hypothetical protein